MHTFGINLSKLITKAISTAITSDALTNAFSSAHGTRTQMLGERMRMHEIWPSVHIEFHKKKKERRICSDHAEDAFWSTEVEEGK